MRTRRSPPTSSARHHRQRGEETFFLTGVDEHATKVWRVAESQGLGGAGVRRPDRRGLAGACRRRLNAETDFFIRTSDEGHKVFVREFLQRIYDNGDVYEDVYAGLYCVGCEAFKTEDELVDGKCPLHDTVPEWIEEKNYFFRLSRLPGQAARALRGAVRLRAAAVPVQRGQELRLGRSA